MKIRDLRNGEWFWVNNAVMSCPHIDAETYRVYSTLASFGGMPEIRPTVATISKKSCVSVRKVNYAIKKLLEIGFVEIKIGGGRGRSNVYNLLKAVKGCTQCSVSKPCTDEQETLHETTLNSAQGAHHKDIYKNNKKDIAPIGATHKEIISLMDLFQPINPLYEEMYRNTTEREALSFLASRIGLEKLQNTIKALPEIVGRPYAPNITKPTELRRNLAKLINYANQEKNKSIKSRIVIV